MPTRVTSLAPAEAGPGGSFAGASCAMPGCFQEAWLDRGWRGRSLVEDGSGTVGAAVGPPMRLRAARMPSGDCEADQCGSLAGSAGRSRGGYSKSRDKVLLWRMRCPSKVARKNKPGSAVLGSCQQPRRRKDDEAGIRMSSRGPSRPEGGRSPGILGSRMCSVCRSGSAAKARTNMRKSCRVPRS